MADNTEIGSNKFVVLTKTLSGSSRVYIGVHPDVLGTFLSKVLNSKVDCWIDLTHNENYSDYIVSKRKIKAPFRKGGILPDVALRKLVDYIFKCVSIDRSVYIHCDNGGERTMLVSVCLLMRMFKLKYDDALEKLKCGISKKTKKNVEINFNPMQLSQLKRYRFPLRVLICGDRNSHHEYRDILEFEIKALPPGSVVIGGDSKGIDRLAKEIAEKLGVSTETYPIQEQDWNIYGIQALKFRTKKNTRFRNRCSDCIPSRYFF